MTVKSLTKSLLYQLTPISAEEAAQITPTRVFDAPLRRPLFQKAKAGNEMTTEQRRRQSSAALASSARDVSTTSSTSSSRRSSRQQEKRASVSQNAHPAPLKFGL